MRILIAGGGIGGLSAAIALHRAGFQPLVFERDPGPREAGAGITLWSNALLAAAHLGIDGPLRAAGDEVISGRIRNRTGTVLLETPVAEIGRELDAPSLCLPRSTLMDLLRAAVPPESLRFGARVTGFRQDASGVDAELEGGESIRGDLLVGCDGLRSAIRERLFGPEIPRYAGHLCFRAMVRFPGLAVGASFETWGPGCSFGLVPMRGDDVYWFANVGAAEGTRFPGVKSALLERYGGWHEPVRELIERTPEESILCHEVYDRDPRDAWGEGRVTLLGDAAHPATPDLGQGGCLALEDAVVLSTCLAEIGASGPALRAYEELRRDRANRLLRKSRWFGWIGHLRSPLLGAIRNFCVRATPAFLMTRDYRKIVDYDARTQRPGRNG